MITTANVVLDRYATHSGARLLVLREDLFEGGGKALALQGTIAGCDEVVYGGPFCGAAPWAVAVVARTLGKKATLFYAARAWLHSRQVAARENGAVLFFVSPGYMTVVQARARAYAEEQRAAGVNCLLVPLGADLPSVRAALFERAELVADKVGSPPEVWCAMGSGMLASVLSEAFPSSAIMAVAVGLASRHSSKRFNDNVRVMATHPRLRFEQESRASIPWPSCRNYDAKAADMALTIARPGALFWNVAGA